MARGSARALSSYQSLSYGVPDGRSLERFDREVLRSKRAGPEVAEVERLIRAVGYSKERALQRQQS